MSGAYLASGDSTSKGVRSGKLMSDLPQAIKRWCCSAEQSCGNTTLEPRALNHNYVGFQEMRVRRRV